MRSASLITVVTLLITRMPVAFADLAGADRAFERGMYTSAFREYRSLADSGNADAQYRLGEMYNSGKGLPENPAKAAAWYRKAALQGHPAAQNRRGLAS